MDSRILLNFVILAGGRGERMNSKLPKPLHPIGEKTMLGRVVASAEELGPAKIVVVYSDEKVKKRALRLGCEAALQEKPLGTADALKAALKKCDEEAVILVSCADIPLVSSSVYRKLYLKHIREGNYITLLAARTAEPGGYGRVVREKGRVLRIVEEKEASPGEKEIDLINSGIYCMESRGLKDYLALVEKSAVKKEYYLTDLVEISARDDKKIGLLECEYNLVMGVNTPGQRREAERRIEKIEKEKK